MMKFIIYQLWLKKILFSLVLFFCFQNILAVTSLEEKKSFELIEKLYQDKFYRVAFQEIKWFQENFPNSNNTNEINLFKGSILSKINQPLLSLDVLSEIDLKIINLKQKQQLFFYQARNYFFLQQFNISSQFFQRLTTQEAKYYLIIINILQGNSNKANTILAEIKLKELSAGNALFLKSLKKQDNLENILESKKITALQKVIFTRFLAEQKGNALEKYFLFELQTKNRETNFSNSLITFFIGEALYKASLLENSLDNNRLLLAAKFYLEQHLTKKIMPLDISYFYLATISHKLKDYKSAFNYYQLLLNNANYINQKYLVLNYLTLKEVTQIEDGDIILLSAIDNQKNFKDKQELSLKLLTSYLNKQSCQKIIQNFVTNPTSPLKTEIGKSSSTEYLFAGNCFFSKKQTKLALLYLTKINPNEPEVLNATKTIAQKLGQERDKNSFNIYFNKISSASTDYLQEIQKNSLAYFYYAQDWKNYPKQVEKYLQNYPNSVLDLQTVERLAFAYQKNKQTELALQKYRLILEETTTKAEKIRIARIIIKQLQEQKKYGEIAQTYTKISTILPEQEHRINLIIGKNWFAANNYQNAIKYLNKIVSKENIEPEIYLEANYFLAEIYIIEEKIKKTITILTESVTPLGIDNKWYLVMHHRLGQIYRSQKNWEKALFHFKAVTKTKGNSEEKEFAKIRVKATKKLLAARKKQKN